MLGEIVHTPAFGMESVKAADMSDNADSIYIWKEREGSQFRRWIEIKDI